MDHPSIPSLTRRGGSGAALKKRKTKSAWTVYILRCADGSLYTGITRDVARRVEEHNSNGLLAARYTRARRLVALVYQEPAATRSKASKREYRIKRMTRAHKLKLVGVTGLLKAKVERRKAKGERRKCLKPSDE